MVFQVGFRKEWEPNMVEVTKGFLSTHRDILQLDNKTEVNVTERIKIDVVLRAPDQQPTFQEASKYIGALSPGRGNEATKCISAIHEIIQ